MQGIGQHLDQLVHESVQDVLGGPLPGAYTTLYFTCQLNLPIWCPCIPTDFWLTHPSSFFPYYNIADVSHPALPAASFELPPLGLQMPIASGGDTHAGLSNGGNAAGISSGVVDSAGQLQAQLLATTSNENANTEGNEPGGDNESNALDGGNNSGRAGNNLRPRRRAAAAAVGNFATDIEASDEDSDEEEGQETGSSGRPGTRANKRRRGGAGNATGNTDAGGGTGNRDGATKIEKKSQHMQGRFSGRLPTKEDERKLADECQLMAPLLSEDGSLCTLPTIIRAMATGSVRHHLEKQRDELNSLNNMIASIQNAPGGHHAIALSEQVVQHQAESSRLRNHVQQLEQQLADMGISNNPQGDGQQHELRRGGSLPTSTTMAAAGATPTMSLPMQTVTVPVLSSIPSTSAPQSMVVQVPTANGMQQTQVVQMPATDVPNAIVAQQVLADGTTQPVVVATVPPAAAAAPVAAGSGMLRSVPSSAQLVDANGQPTGVTVAVAAAPAPAAAAPTSAGNDNPAQAAGVAASNLNEHAQQLTVTAKLHEAAKTEASVQAQQLAAQAQQHAQASVQAAHQAEELKRTLSVLPDTHQTQQAAATVQNLEARAQAHASITTQVVAQARGMHEKAKAHESEQYKAITQATVLQAHAQSLQVSAQQLEVHQVVTQTVATSGQEGGAAALSGEMNGHDQNNNHNLSGLPTTPISNGSGGGATSLFTAAGPATTTAPAATVAMMQPTLLPGQQVQLVTSTAPVTTAPQPMVPSSLGQTGLANDQSVEVAALHQQIAALQAQQQVQQAQQAASLAPQTIQVQVLHPQHGSLPRVTSHGGMLNLMQSGSGAITTIDSTGMVASEQQQQLQMTLPPSNTSAELDVPQGLENLLPSSQPLLIDPNAAEPTMSEMDHVVSLPNLMSNGEQGRTSSAGPAENSS